MLFTEIVRVALGALVANKARALLAMFGIIIGVGAVITMLAMGEGAQRLVLKAITSEEKNQLTIFGNAEGYGYWSGHLIWANEYRALREETRYIRAVLPFFSGNRGVSFRRKASGWEERGVSIAPAGPEFFPAAGLRLAAGRFLTDADDQARRPVVVLGAEAAKSLGFQPYMVGQAVRIEEHAFEVVGVAEPTGNIGWEGIDSFAMIPPNTVEYLQLGSWETGDLSAPQIWVWVTLRDHILDATEETVRILRRMRRLGPQQENDFAVNPNLDLTALKEKTAETFGSLLLGVAAVSLVVGGIGVMNIMLVSVTERTREIGIRRAVGATGAAILVQFVLEAVVLCLLGGCLGAGTGWYAARLMSQNAGWPSVVTPESVILALGVSVAVGLFFGIYPAIRASRLDPVEALRYE